MNTVLLLQYKFIVMVNICFRNPEAQDHREEDGVSEVHAFNPGLQPDGFLTRDKNDKYE